MRLILFSTIFSCISVWVSAQNQRLNEEFAVDCIDVRRGLLSNFVTKTISDKDNIKYFATEGGVSKFDGYSFTSFRPSLEFKELENENIETLFRSQDDNIWIGTKGGGLSVLNTTTNKIKSLNPVFSNFPNKKLRVIAINQSHDGYIWVGTWNSGVFVVDPKNDKLIAHYDFLEPVYNIIRDQYQNMWFISGTGLHKYDPSESRLLSFNIGKTMYNFVEDKSRNKLWLVGNSGKNVVLFSFSFIDQQIRDEKINLTARFTKSIALDDKNRLWIGSWGDGLYISDATVSKFQRINTSPQGRSFENVNNTMIIDIDIDKNGIAWLGTAYGGVLVLYPNKGFRLLSAFNKNTSMDQNITSIFKDKAGKLYKGTITEGLFVGDDNGNFSKIKSIANTRINCVYEKENLLFVGTNLGLYIVKDRNFDKPQLFFENDKITAVLLDSKHNLWIGTQQKGLKRTNLTLDPTLESCKKYDEKEPIRTLDNNRISQIKEDDTGNIWLATYAGLNLYDRQNDTFITNTKLLGDKLPSVIINDIHIKGKDLYLGTPAGLVILHFEGGKVKITELYNREHGLMNDFICSIEEDTEGYIWLSTTTSITKYQPQLKNFINFDREDGVMINSFHISSSLFDDIGEMYFGGSNGIVAFNPKLINDKFNLPEIVLTNLTVNNKVLKVEDKVDGKVILYQTIQNTDKIELGYAQNNLSLSFAANDFLGSNNITYAYKLEGINKDWVYLDTRNEISFTELGSDDYELLIKASRNNQNWSEARRLKISIATPPWLTWYAFTFYVLVFFGILILFRNNSNKQASLKAELRILQIEKEKEHELNEAKISFFTNVSHEFRTPLTLILGPVTELLESQKVVNGVRDKLQLVESNAKRMLSLINQLLDFRKSEHGLLTLRLTRSDFIAFSKEVCLGFNNIARNKKINYIFETNIDKWYFDFDRNQMEIVLSNLLSNAFKYTLNKGDIKVKISKNIDFAVLEVTDSGIGISEENQKNVFSRFFQVQDTGTANVVGSGIGLSFSKNIIDLHGGKILVDSKLGLGSTFRIELPVLNDKEINLPKAQSQNNSLDRAMEEETDAKENIGNHNKTQRFSILIADDNDDIRQYLKTLLQDDYDVSEAVDGMEAFSMINKDLPDLIISDVMMPNMDGIQLCHEIKNQINTSHIPIILLTARTSSTHEIDGLQMGADDYITKPFNPSVVKTRVFNILENRKKLREYFFNKVRFEPNTQEVSESNLDVLFIDKAIKLVNENIQNDDFGIEVMVDQLFMSQATLYRKIKSLTGLSLTGFIRSVKLKKAAQLILKTDMKLSLIAMESGFNDYKYFKKSFQSQFDCLPSEYKNKILVEQK